MTTLYAVENEKKYKITSVPDVSLLQMLGVFEGSVVSKKNTYGFGGPVLLVIDAREVAIGKNYAQKILVEPQ